MAEGAITTYRIETESLRGMNVLKHPFKIDRNLSHDNTGTPALSILGKGTYFPERHMLPLNEEGVKGFTSQLITDVPASQGIPSHKTITLNLWYKEKYKYRQEVWIPKSVTFVAEDSHIADLFTRFVDSHLKLAGKQPDNTNRENAIRQWQRQGLSFPSWLSEAITGQSQAKSTYTHHQMSSPYAHETTTANEKSLPKPEIGKAMIKGRAGEDWIHIENNPAPNKWEVDLIAGLIDGHSINIIDNSRPPTSDEEENLGLHVAKMVTPLFVKHFFESEQKDPYQAVLEASRKVHKDILKTYPVHVGACGVILLRIRNRYMCVYLGDPTFWRKTTKNGESTWGWPTYINPQRFEKNDPHRKQIQVYGSWGDGNIDFTTQKPQAVWLDAGKDVLLASDVVWERMKPNELEYYMKNRPANTEAQQIANEVRRRENNRYNGEKNRWSRLENWRPTPPDDVSVIVLKHRE